MKLHGFNFGVWIKPWCVTIHIKFSNLLIMHQIKTKKITTVKEVWILGVN